MKEYFITIAASELVSEDDRHRLTQECHSMLENMSLDQVEIFVYKSRMAWTLAMHQLMYRKQNGLMQRERIAISSAWTGLKAHLRDEMDIEP